MAPANRKRHCLIESGVIKDGIFTVDYEFSSPTMTAAVILGTQISGNLVWLDEEGKKARRDKMINFLTNLGRRIRLFMQGRYGYDELSRFISILALIIMFLSWIPYLRFLYLVAVVLLIISTLRSFSRNINKRLIERNKYLKIRNRITGKISLLRDMWKDRKTHRYYRCPNCKAVMRIAYPGKGRLISVHCQKCGGRFDKKT